MATPPLALNPFAAHTKITINGVEYHAGSAIDQNPASSNNSESMAIRFAIGLLDKGRGVEVFSSGSTGAPKKLDFTKTAVYQSASATNAFFGLHSASRGLLALPMKYIAAKMMVARAIVGGFPLTVLEPSGNPLAESHNHTFIPLTPYQMENGLGSGAHKNHPGATFLLGGAAPSAALRYEIDTRSIAAYSSFGMAETLSHFALAKLDDHKQPMVYTPLHGVALTADIRHRLQVRWEGIVDGQLHTNDIVALSGGGFIWKGRADHLINSGGVKIIPEEVEGQLSGYLKTGYFVHGIPHQALGQQVVVFLEGNGSLDLDKISFSEPYQKPKRIIRIEKFLRTYSGKIKREATAAAWLKSQS